MPFTTQEEGVITVFDEEKNLVAIIYKDMKSRKNLFFGTSEMSMDELKQLISSDKSKIKTP